MLRAGFETPYWYPSLGYSAGWLHAAKLVTPVPIFPLTYRSVWARDDGGIYLPYLSTADLLGYEDPVFFYPLLTNLPFPYGYDVIPDDVPL